MFRIGIDLGGTKIEAILMDAQGEIRARERIATPGDYAGMLDALADLVARIGADLPADTPVGVGHPGSTSPATGRMRNSNSTWLNDQPFAADLADRLARPVRLANDADCFALSEAMDGAGEGARTVFGVILGTGVGGGLVIDGALHSGAGGTAGEWGHNPLPWPQEDEYPGPACWCGRQGCLETWLSGPGWARDFEARFNIKTSAQAIGQAIQSGDAQALEARALYANRLARGLASVINLVDPDIIVLGGGVSNTPGLAQATEAALAPYVFSDRVVTRIRRNQHGDSSGVRGAAWLWPAS